MDRVSSDFIIIYKKKFFLFFFGLLSFLVTRNLEKFVDLVTHWNKVKMG